MSIQGQPGSAPHLETGKEWEKAHSAPFPCYFSIDFSESHSVPINLKASE